MKEIKSDIETRGIVELIVTNVITNEIVRREFHNTVLTIGKQMLAKTIANDIGATPIFVENMLFGQGGEDESVPKSVDTGRTSLFNFISGTRITAASAWNSEFPTRATFSATLDASTANGSTINEAALELSNNDLLSMITFGGLSKTSSLAFTLNWTVIFV